MIRSPNDLTLGCIATGESDDLTPGVETVTGLDKNTQMTIIHEIYRINKEINRLVNNSTISAADKCLLDNLVIQRTQYNNMFDPEGRHKIIDEITRLSKQIIIYRNYCEWDRLFMRIFRIPIFGRKNRESKYIMTIGDMHECRSILIQRL
jgi:hypothetical protein